MGRLSGKVAIVSGGARGQGAAEVRLFVAEGAQVLFGDVLDDLGNAVEKELGDNAVFLHHDVRDETAWLTMVSAAENHFGKLDILVNNAGILQFGTLTHETSLEDYMDTEVFLHYYEQEGAVCLHRFNGQMPVIGMIRPQRRNVKLLHHAQRH